jgi:hypothetical protein
VDKGEAIAKYFWDGALTSAIITIIVGEGASAGGTLG